MELPKSDLKAIQEGRLNLFENLIDCYQDRMCALTFKMTRNEDDAKEVTQIAFIKCYQNIKSYAYNATFSVWLYAITYNESLTFLKKKKRWVYGHFENEYHQPVQMPEVENNLLKKDKQDLVKGLLKTLNPKERLLLNLFYMEELSYKEIVQVTKMSISNVKVMIHRAKNKLKKNLNYSFN